MVGLSAWLTILGMGVIAGIALTTLVIVYPVLTSVSKPAALEVFKPFFMRTHHIVLKLSVVVTFTALLASIMSGNWWWFVMALFMHFNGPYTYFRMMPTNHRLMSDDIDPASKQVETDLNEWGYLHAVRVAVNGLVFAVFVLLAIHA